MLERAGRRLTNEFSYRMNSRTDRARHWLFQNAIIGLITIVILVAGSALAARAEDKAPPTVDYWHVWIDSAGVSHQTRCEMKGFVLQSIEPPASPQWLKRLKAEGASIVMSVLPVGWIGTWHENPKPQWIIPLSGRWFVKTSDGKRVEMGPGELSFGEDQNAKPVAGGHRGHVSGTIGQEPAVLMIVQLKELPTIGEPCHFE